MIRSIKDPSHGKQDPLKHQEGESIIMSPNTKTLIGKVFIHLKHLNNHHFHDRKREREGERE